MRTEPGSNLRFGPGSRWTKQGRSTGPSSACQLSVLPLGPATEVNVPHSCTTSPSPGKVASANTGAASSSTTVQLRTVMEEPSYRTWPLDEINHGTVNRE